ncbi:hypothetical protein ABE28_020010 [Peribacillus muralis]|uniref:DUF4279 domain-containing protein n=1 Tax=Peribacillus muralis TaxID=264697 RepID=A0A1B3XTW5_9BACI|nr:DUF4279 domain-containing protein [Peribacillus muralis]AOH56659.1 hypothetical protein ABE28_020010 [Peribacillus muralis]
MKKTQVMVYFSLFGDDFPIDEVTKSLGITPTLTYKKGDIIPRHNSLNSLQPHYRKETAWDLSSGYQESYDVTEQMDQVFVPLKNQAAVINQLKENYHLQCKFFIVIKMENGHSPGLYLDNEQVDFASKVKAGFDIDLYANPYNDSFDD